MFYKVEKAWKVDLFINHEKMFIDDYTKKPELGTNLITDGPIINLNDVKLVTRNPFMDIEGQKEKAFKEFEYLVILEDNTAISVSKYDYDKISSLLLEK